MDHPFSAQNAPYGPTASAQDVIPLTAPTVDTPVEKPVRGFVALSAGTVSITTQMGHSRTFDVPAGLPVACCITHVLAATTADLLLYTD